MENKIKKGTLPKNGKLKEMSYEIVYDKTITDIVLYREIYSEGQDIIYWRCPKCHNIHVIKKPKITDAGTIYTNNEEITHGPVLMKVQNSWRVEFKAICPACGLNMDSYPAVLVSMGQEGFVPYYIAIIKTDKGLTFKIYEEKVIPNINAKKWARKDKSTVTLTFLNNGRTVMTETLTKKGETERKFYNVTYASGVGSAFFKPVFEQFLLSEDVYELKKAIAESFSEHIGRAMPQGVNEQILPFMNNMHDMPMAFYDSCCRLNDTRKAKNLFKHIKRGNFRYLDRTCKCGKAIKKLIMENPMNSLVYKDLKHVGFSDENHIRRIIKNIPDIYNIADADVLKTIFDFLGEYKTDDPEKYFACILLKHTRGDYNTSYYDPIFFETARIINTVTNKSGFDELFDSRMIKQDMIQIHDYLSELNYKLKHEKIQYNYTSEEIKLIGNEFILPETNHKLIEYGQEFRNCVGTYVDRIGGRKTLIVIKLKNKNPDVCIELHNTGTGYKLIQAKQFANRLMSERQFNEVTEWLQKKKISYKECTDITRLLNDDGSFNEKMAGQNAYGFVDNPDMPF